MINKKQKILRKNCIQFNPSADMLEELTAIKKTTKQSLAFIVRELVSIGLQQYNSQNETNKKN
jgi:hypothetical protein